MSLLFRMLSRFVTVFLPRSKRLLISWLQSLSAVILEPKKIKSVTASTFPPSICHEVMGPDAMILAFWMLSFKPAFSLSSARVHWQADPRKRGHRIITTILSGHSHPLNQVPQGGRKWERNVFHSLPSSSSLMLGLSSVQIRPEARGQRSPVSAEVSLPEQS